MQSLHTLMDKKTTQQKGVSGIDQDWMNKLIIWKHANDWILGKDSKVYHIK